MGEYLIYYSLSLFFIYRGYRQPWLLLHVTSDKTLKRI